MAISRPLMKAYGHPNLRRDARSESTYLRAAARTCSWKLVLPTERNFLSSYEWAKAETPAGFTAILLHLDGQVAAYSAGVPAMTLKFADHPEFSAAMIELGWPVEILSVAELDQPLTQEDREFLVSLQQGFRNDLRLYRPQCLGEVIFNWWG